MKSITVDISYKEILNYKKILDNFLDKDLPIQLSALIAKNSLIMSAGIDKFSDLEIEITKKYYKETEDGKITIIDESKKEELKKEIGKLVESKIRIFIVICNIEDLIELQGNLSPKELIDLGFMINGLNF